MCVKTNKYVITTKINLINFAHVILILKFPGAKLILTPGSFQIANIGAK